MEASVCAVSEPDRQLFVLLLILDVTELVMDRVQVLKAVVARAHFDAKVALVVKVPGSGVAHDLAAVGRLAQHRVLPEGGRRAQQTHRNVKVVGSLKHFLHCVVLKEETEVEKAYKLPFLAHTCFLSCSVGSMLSISG